MLVSISYQDVENQRVSVSDDEDIGGASRTLDVIVVPDGGWREMYWSIADLAQLALVGEERVMDSLH